MPFFRPGVIVQELSVHQQRQSCILQTLQMRELRPVEMTAGVTGESCYLLLLIGVSLPVTNSIITFVNSIPYSVNSRCITIHMSQNLPAG